MTQKRHPYEPIVVPLDDPSVPYSLVPVPSVRTGAMSTIYQQKPTEQFECEHFSGTESEAWRLKTWVGPMAVMFRMSVDDEDAPWFIEIPRLGGTYRANPGDWIVRNSKGEFSTLTNEQFIDLYEPSQLA